MREVDLDNILLIYLSNFVTVKVSYYFRPVARCILSGGYWAAR